MISPVRLNRLNPSARPGAAILVVLCAVLTWLGAPTFAQAATINTYDFSQPYSNEYGDSQLSGTFRGLVDAGGLMSLSGLQTFTLTYLPHLGPYTIDLPVTIFSYNTTGGASSLNFAGSIGNFNFCGGFATAIYCQDQDAHLGRAGAYGTFAQPVITLVSSVPVAVAPVPAALPMFALALAAAGLFAGMRRAMRSGLGNSAAGVA